ncbi:MAG: hypothetical protein A2X12_06295 [Bacteroidetes bacterium GWE2_29_8]|nr:MAG: hypothetical protein A2X12_06295 [Bacteroidetes bacterium GWE2_29_8]
MQLELDAKYDKKASRHFINGNQVVFHCHHFTTLYTQLAIDADETQLLHEVARESFYNVLQSYYKQKNITDVKEKIELACQYYSAIGLGTLTVKFMGSDSGEVISENSHVEKGWIAKWGKYDKPVNYIGTGYIAAMFASSLELPIKTFGVREEKSLVKGDDYTLFKIVKN